MQAEENLVETKEQKGERLIDRDVAIQKIIGGEISRFGFLKAMCPDLPEDHFYYDMIYGWFDLADEDHQAKLIGDDVFLELWFHGTQFPLEAIVKSRQRNINELTYYQTKLNVKIAKSDFDYVTLDGHRHYIDLTPVITEPDWVNYGDVNPIEHGGIFVKEENETTFRIVKLQFVDDDGKNLLLDLNVDISDSWIEKEAVMNYAGISEADEDFSVNFAIACTEFYSPGNFGCHENIYLTLEESEEHLKQYDISKEHFRAELTPIVN
jgi:hypothetical protein